MIEFQDVQDYVTRPTLKALQMWGPSAEVLVMGTIAKESRGGTFLRQIGKNGQDIRDPAVGAYGICQMEGWVHTDQWDNWLRYRPDRVALLFDEFGIDRCPPHGWLMTNLAYSVAMCRIHYWRVLEPLPAPDDLQGLGRYWDTHYNRNPDHGTAQQWVAAYLNWKSRHA